MCGPITPVLGLALSAGGTLLQINQQMQVTKQQQAVYNAAARRAEIEQQIQEEDTERRRRIYTAQARNLFAASGVDTASGSPADFEISTAAEFGKEIFQKKFVTQGTTDDLFARSEIAGSTGTAANIGSLINFTSDYLKRG